MLACDLLLIFEDCALDQLFDSNSPYESCATRTPHVRKLSVRNMHSMVYKSSATGKAVHLVASGVPQIKHAAEQLTSHFRMYNTDAVTLLLAPSDATVAAEFGTLAKLQQDLERLLLALLDGAALERLRNDVAAKLESLRKAEVLPADVSFAPRSFLTLLHMPGELQARKAAVAQFSAQPEFPCFYLQDLRSSFLLAHSGHWNNAEL